MKRPFQLLHHAPLLSDQAVGDLVQCRLDLFRMRERFQLSLQLFLLAGRQLRRP